MVEIPLGEQIRDSNFFLVPHNKSPKVFSGEIDKLLGFKISKVEQGLLKKYRAFYKEVDESNKKKHYPDAQVWIGLHPRVLLTPYSEILKFLLCFKNHPPKRVVDLGAAYGRVGIVLNAVFPKSQFIGVELLDVRVNEANRIYEKHSLSNCQMIQRNVVDREFEIPEADLYFIYDFGSEAHIKLVLDKIIAKMKERRVSLIVKGDLIRSIIQLHYPIILVKNRVDHQKEWSIYSSH